MNQSETGGVQKTKKITKRVGKEVFGQSRNLGSFQHLPSVLVTQNFWKKTGERGLHIPEKK